MPGFDSGAGFDRPRGAGYGAPMTKRKPSIGIRTFRQLIEALHERTGQRVTVLVD